MKLSQMEPLAIPPAMTDAIFSLLFVFTVLTGLLVADINGARAITLRLPELDKGLLDESRGAGAGAVEIGILRSGAVTADGAAVEGARGLAGKVRAGQAVVIGLEKGAAGELLIAVEAQLKKLGVREVTVLVKEAK